jgi:plastocyanin
MRRSVTVLLAIVFAALWSTSAGAVTRTVDATSSFTFDPTLVKIGQGGTVQWHNTSGFPHTTTQDSGLILWDKQLSAGASKSVRMDLSGTFLYHCTIHGGNGGVGMSGVVKVPVKTSPKSGPQGTTFTITLAGVVAPSGLVFDVQQRIGAGPWQAFLSGVTTQSVQVSPPDSGTYSYRSRVRKTSNGAHGRFSPARSISVTETP